MRTLIGGRCTHSNVFSRAVLIPYVSLKHHASYESTFDAMLKALDDRDNPQWFESAQATRCSFATATHVTRFLVTIARGTHLFPFRTEPLSPAAPMVLP